MPVFWLVIAVLIALAVFFLRNQWRRSTVGSSGMIGRKGVAQTDLAPPGRVLVEGENWQAESEEPIAAGEPIEVVEVVSLRLLVRRAK